MVNIGPAAGAAPGLVIASPSASHPDYFYTWTRDSALTFATILRRMLPADKASEPELESLLREYVLSQAAIQLVDNPSGGLFDGGLGEPKFTVEGQAFQGSWGRPQRDGPALRALVTGRFAAFLLGRARPLDEPYVRSTLYDASQLIAPSTSSNTPQLLICIEALLTKLMTSPDSVLKSDLEYTGHTWCKPSFDIWEEVQGIHFFTLLAARSALTCGADVALTLDDKGAADYYEAGAAKLSGELESFWLAKKGFISASRDAQAHGRTGLDAAVLLAILRVGPAAADNTTHWSVADDRVLATVERYVNSFAGDLYAINNATRWQKSWHGAIAVGRYAEDVYDGDSKSAANPWYITTFAVGEILHKIAAHVLKSRRIVVSPVSLAFWQKLDHSLSAGQVLKPFASTRKPDRFERVVDDLLAYADGFIRIGQTFAGPGGTLSEQFDRLDGSPTGARNLTWSYASLLEAADARQMAYDLRSAL